MTQYLNQHITIPNSVGKEFNKSLETQIRDFGIPRESDTEISRLLIDRDELDAFSIKVLESQKRLFKAVDLPPGRRQLKKRLERMLLRKEDAAARKEIAEALGIDDLDLQADALVSLRELDPQLFEALLSGALGTALRLIPAQGYGTVWCAEDVTFFVDQMARLWMAHDLQIEASACRSRMFRPTGWDILDGGGRKVPKMGGIVAVIERELKIFEEAERLYFRDALGGAASEKETRVFRRNDLDLEQRAQDQLALWRKEHGDDLEEFIRVRMIEARCWMARLRRAIDEIQADTSLARTDAHRRNGPGELIRLWLACERAVGWAAESDHGEEAIERCELCPLERALIAARKGTAIQRPDFHKANVERVRRLFIALRCTILRDPNYLPASLRMRERGNRPCRADAMARAEMGREAPVAFSGILSHYDEYVARVGSEGFSNAFTTPANHYVKSHEREPTEESVAIMDSAWGTVEWRLLQ